jgi:hypothetical protein
LLTVCVCSNMNLLHTFFFRVDAHRCMMLVVMVIKK